jgi:hypothetical protein
VLEGLSVVGTRRFRRAAATDRAALLAGIAAARGPVSERIVPAPRTHVTVTPAAVAAAGPLPTDMADAPSEHASDAAPEAVEPALVSVGAPPVDDELGLGALGLAEAAGAGASGAAGADPGPSAAEVASGDEALEAARAMPDSPAPDQAPPPMGPADPVA